MSRYRGGASSTLYIKNISDKVRYEDMKRLFQKYGKVIDVTIPLDYHHGLPKGYCFVEYEDPRDAEEAQYKMDRQRLFGKEIEVEFARGDRKTPGEMRTRDRDVGYGGDVGGYGGGYGPPRRDLYVAPVGFRGEDRRYASRGGSDRMGNGRDRMDNGRDRMGNGRDRMDNGRDRMGYYEGGGRGSAIIGGGYEGKRSRSRSRHNDRAIERRGAVVDKRTSGLIGRRSRSRSRSGSPVYSKNRTPSPRNNHNAKSESRSRSRNRSVSPRHTASPRQRGSPRRSPKINNNMSRSVSRSPV